MRKSRVVYSNKVVNAAVSESVIETTDLDAGRHETGDSDTFQSLNAVRLDTLERLVVPPDIGERLDRIREQVQLAIQKLDENEREFIARFYYMGESYRQMASASGRRIYSLEALHRRALKKLRKALAAFAESEFGVARERPAKPCVICDSVHRMAIDALIQSRAPETTWKSVMRSIAERYGVRVATPQVLIGHQKYHV